MGVNLTLEYLRRIVKIFHEEWKWIFIICEFSFVILDSISLSITR